MRTAIRATGSHALSFGMLLIGLSSSGVLADDSEREAPTAKGPCVAVSTEAVYRGYGFDHLVHLDNQCKKPMRCHVSTNATPEPLEVALAVDEKRTLTTFRGSPARELTADVKCEEDTR